MKIFSFLSGFPITWYIIAALLASLSLSVWILQGKIEEIGGYKAAQASYVEALKSSQKQLETKDLSCKIDNTSVVELEAEKSAIKSNSDVIERDILKLKQPSAKAPVKSKEIVNNEVTYLPDNGLLSPSLLSLLHKSFCTAEPTDLSCTP
jgi:hypothetical protein